MGKTLIFFQKKHCLARHTSRPDLRYILLAEPRQARMPLQAGLSEYVLFSKPNTRLYKTKNYKIAQRISCSFLTFEEVIILKIVIVKGRETSIVFTDGNII